MKLTMSISVIGGSSLRMKLYFTFAILVCLKLGIILILNKVSDRFIKGSNWYPHRVMGIFDIKECTAGIIKSGVTREHPSGIVIKAIGGLAVFLSV